VLASVFAADCMIGTAYIYAFSGGAVNSGAVHILHPTSQQEHHT